MDNNLLALIDLFQETRRTLFLSLIVDGTLITGYLIDEQNFYVETNREESSQSPANRERTGTFEDIFLAISHNLTSAPTVHLADVRVYSAGRFQELPSLRVELGHISGWTFAKPASGAELLQRVLQARLDST